MEKTTLIFIGLWSGSPDSELFDPDLPNPAHLVDPEWEAENKDRIVNYLRSGHWVVWWGDVAYDRFTNEQTEDMGSSEFTDGVYIWPEGLPVYLEKYNVRLPNEFVDHVKRNNYIVPDANLNEVDAFADEYEKIFSFWEEWGKRNAK